MIQGLKLPGGRDGAFAVFFSVNNAAANLVLLSDAASVGDAPMTADMMSTGLYGAGLADTKLGDSAVAFGIGPLRLMAIAGAALMGAGRIIGIGARPNCAALARECGATDIASYGEVASSSRSGLWKTRSGACIVACSSAASVSQALALTRSGGTVATIDFRDVTDALRILAYERGLGMSGVSPKRGFCPGGARRIRRPPTRRPFRLRPASSKSF